MARRANLKTVQVLLGLKVPSASLIAPLPIGSKMAFAPTAILGHVMSAPLKSAQPNPVVAIASLGAIVQRRPGVVARWRN